MSEEAQNPEPGDPAESDSTTQPGAAPVDTPGTPAESIGGDFAETAAEPETSAETEPSGRATEPATPDETAAQAPAEDPPPSRARPAKPKSGKKPLSPTKRASLYRAFRSGRGLEGEVEQVIKGGYEVRVAKVRCFCPHSQIAIERVEDPEVLVGNSYTFRITQLRRGGEDVVVSRRAILEEEQKENAKAVRATLVEGSVMQGRVSGAAPFGVFVDLGAGVKGLVHVSEVSHHRSPKLEDVAAVGETVWVKVLKVDDRRGRISLSMRQATDDPWADVEQRFRAGQVYPGTIRRLTDFGAFVELAPGLEALAPASELPPSRLGWKEGLEVGKQGDWLVLSVDSTRRRISLTAPSESSEPDGGQPLAPGTKLHGRVQRVEKFGVFVWLGPGRVGLVPNVWTGTPRGTDLTRSFSIGDPIEVEIVELGEDGRKIRLTKAGVQPKLHGPAEGQAERGPQGRRQRSRPTDRPPAAAAELPEETGSFGTSLAEKLKAALARPDSGS